MQIIGDGGHAKVVRTVEVYRSGWIIAVGDNAARKREVLAHAEHDYGIRIDASANIASDVEIGEGTVIMAGAIVQAGAVIGKHCILNTGCTVDHDCILEDFVHIAPGANLCGNVRVGEGALVGVGVGVAPGGLILPWTLAKAASLKICPIPTK